MPTNASGLMSDDDCVSSELANVPLFLFTPSGNVKAYVPKGVGELERALLRLGITSPSGQLLDYGLKDEWPHGGP